MTDIVEQLRTENSFPPYYGAPKLQHDAADEIESLRFQLNGVIKMRNEVENEITRLRAALEELIWYTNQLELDVYDHKEWPNEHSAVTQARAALGGDND
jgi:hypothetical protein